MMQEILYQPKQPEPDRDYQLKLARLKELESSIKATEFERTEKELKLQPPPAPPIIPIKEEVSDINDQNYQEFDVDHFEKKMTLNMVSENEIDEFRRLAQQRSPTKYKKTKPEPQSNDDQVIKKVHEINKLRTNEHNQKLKLDEKEQEEFNNLLKQKRFMVKQQTHQMQRPNENKKHVRDTLMLEQTKKRNELLTQQIEELRKEQEIQIKTGLHNNFYNDGFVQRQMQFLKNMNQNNNNATAPEEKVPVAIYYAGRKGTKQESQKSMLTDLKRQMEMEEEYNMKQQEIERLRQKEEKDRLELIRLQQEIEAKTKRDIAERMRIKGLKEKEDLEVKKRMELEAERLRQLELDEQLRRQSEVKPEEVQLPQAKDIGTEVIAQRKGTKKQYVSPYAQQRIQNYLATDEYKTKGQISPSRTAAGVFQYALKNSPKRQSTSG